MDLDKFDPKTKKVIEVEAEKVDASAVVGSGRNNRKYATITGSDFKRKMENPENKGRSLTDLFPTNDNSSNDSIEKLKEKLRNTLIEDSSSEENSFVQSNEPGQNDNEEELLPLNG